MYKKIIPIIILGIFLSFQENDKVIGKWNIYSYEINDVPSKNAPNKWIKFSENGKLEGGDFTNNELKKKGTWKINYKNKTIIFKSEIKSRDDGAYFYELSDSNNKLTLIKDSIKVHMNRIF
jgi:hypothetical protein